MKKYKIKKVGKDFKFIPEINNKGTRKKRVVLFLNLLYDVIVP